MPQRSAAFKRDVSSPADQVNELLAALRRHILGRHFMIAGPHVRGEPGPSPIDVVADLRDEDFRPARVPDFQTLLKLSHPVFGSPELLRPYLMFRDRLLSRCATGNYWVEIPDAEALRDALIAEMRPVCDLPRVGV